MKKLRFAFRYVYHKLFSRFNNLGKRVVFGQGVEIRNTEYIDLGDNVYLENNVILQVLDEHVEYSIKKPKLLMENNVLVGSGTVISAIKFVHIKKKVMIASHCFIGDHDHEYKDINLPIQYQGFKNVAPIVIGEGAWIGANVTICSGVTIGKNSVVGANSVVTNDIPNYSLALGSPAKVVKKFNPKNQIWERIDNKSISQEFYKKIK